MAALDKTTVLDSEALLRETEPSRRFGDYELISEIARGGMGVVYKARQLSLNRLVAVKMILNARFNNPEYIRRFRAEAEAAASLHHPNIVAIYEIGEQDGQHFFSMEYVEGRNLSSVVREQPLPAARAAQFVKIISEAIHYAHQRGFVHRDLKPSNVLIDLEGELRITDFGLAKRLADSDFTATDTSQLTVSGQVLGSPSYMPPEQAAGLSKAVDARSDVYSLGAILYHLLVGRPPFAGETMEATLVQVLQMDPPPPRLLNPGVPRDLETISLRCLEKHRAQRYQSAREVADDLGRFLRREPILARPLGWAGRTWRWCQRKPALAAALASVVLVFAAGLTGVLWQWARAEANARSELQQRRQAEQASVRALLGQARSGRLSGIAGQRFLGLEALGQAAAIQPSLELRNEAIACASLVDVRRGPRWTAAEGDVFAFTDDAGRYARGGRDGSIVIHDAATQQDGVTLPASGAPVMQLRFSHGGGWLGVAHGQDETALTRIWNVRERKVVFEFTNTTSQAFDFDVAHGLVAVGDANGMVSIYSLTNRERVQSIAYDRSCDFVRFDPSGSRLAISSPDSLNVMLFDATSGTEVGRLPHKGVVRGLAWHPEGRLLATACDDKQIHLWDVEGRVEQAWPGQPLVPTDVAFNQRGDGLASYGSDRVLRLWNLAGRELVRLPDISLGALVFTEDDRFIAHAVGEGETSLLEVAWPGTSHQLGDSVARVQPGAQWNSGASNFLALPTFEGVELWNARTRTKLTNLAVGSLNSALFATDGTLVIRGVNGLHALPLRWERLGEDTLIVGPPMLFNFSSDLAQISVGRHGLIAAANVDRITLFRPDSFLPLAELSGQPGIRTVALSADESLVAAGNWDSQQVRIWNVRDRLVVTNLTVPGRALVSFSPDGRWLATSTEKECRLWRTGDWSPAWTGASTAPEPRPIAFDHGSSVLAWASALGTVQLLDLTAKTTIAAWEAGGRGTIAALAFGNDDTELFCAKDGAPPIVWELLETRSVLQGIGLDWGLPTARRTSLAALAPPRVLADIRRFNVTQRAFRDLQDLDRKLKATNDFKNWKMRGLINLNLGRFEAAGDDYARALSLANDANSFEMRAMSLLRLGRTAEAVATYRECLAQHPGNYVSLVQLAQQYLQGPAEWRDIDTGFRYAEEAVAQYPSKGTAHLRLAAAYYCRSNYTAALEALALAQSAKSPAGLATCLMLEIMCHAQMGNKPAAQEAYGRALSALAEDADYPEYKSMLDDTLRKTRAVLHEHGIDTTTRATP